MENQTKMGMNRTGMQMSPIEGPDQVQYALDQPPHPAEGNDGEIAALRAEYVREATRIGSVPLPGTGKGLMDTTIGKIKGKNPEVLIDKLGQRLAYERSGVRLYQAVITKVEAAGHPRQDELLADLVHICNEELEHFHMLTKAIEGIGGDPTAQTPCADVSGVAALGLMQVITDPRTTVAQCLEATLTAELNDNACWELLIELASQCGHDEMAGSFQTALKSEGEHVTMITQWLRETVLVETNVL